MSLAAKHAYLNTRVSVMSIRLLAADALGQLAQQQLPALAERFGLTSLLDEQQSRQARSRAIEQSLIRVLLEELHILIRPMDAPERALLLAWSRKYALYNLKTLIRGKLHALDQKEIRKHLFDLPAIIRLPNQALFQAENVEELLRQLESGPYRQIARQAREVYERQREPFALEAAIDQRYFIWMARQSSGFPASHAEPLRRLIGAVLDRVNLLWLLRFRFSYGLSPSETFYQLVPPKGLLTRERLLKLVDLETFERVLEELPEPLRQQMAESTSIAEVQRRINAHITHEARLVLQRSRSGLARALAYLMLREGDLLALFAVVQGRLLELPQGAIEVALDLSPPNCAWSDTQAA